MSVGRGQQQMKSRFVDEGREGHLGSEDGFGGV